MIRTCLNLSKISIGKLAWRQRRISLINIVCFKYWRPVGSMPAKRSFISTHYLFNLVIHRIFIFALCAFCSDILCRAKFFNINHTLIQTLFSFKEINWKKLKPINYNISLFFLILYLLCNYYFRWVCEHNGSEIFNIAIFCINWYVYKI